jgi:hypothetical protein
MKKLKDMDILCMEMILNLLKILKFSKIQMIVNRQSPLSAKLNGKTESNKMRQENLL